MNDKSRRKNNTCLEPPTRSKIPVKLNVKSEQHDVGDQELANNTKNHVLIHGSVPLLCGDAGQSITAHQHQQ